MLRFPPQISNWMWRVEAHFKTTLQTLTNPLLRSSSYAYLFLTQKIGYHDFMAPFLELLLNTVQLSWLSIFWLRKNHHPTQQQQRDHHTQLLSFLFNQNAIIHLKSSNTNRILARDSNDDDYYCTKSEAHHQMRLHTSISTSAQLSKNLYKVDFEWLKPTLA